MMKRRFYCVIIIILTLLIAFSLVSCDKNIYITKKGEVKDYSIDVLKNLSTISSTYANRTAGSEAEKQFVDYISNYMTDLAFEVSVEEFTILNENDSSYNIVCSKDVDEKSKRILIGCQYDNCYEIFKTHPDGAYESGMAIATLMKVSEIISSSIIPYNVTIVYFGGGVYNWVGADTFVEKYDKSVDLMINYAMLGGGDNLYMYSRDIDVNYNEFFYQVAADNNLSFTKPPKYKKSFDYKVYEDSLYNYTHVGMFGNNCAFMDKKVPTISYMSLNWEAKDAAAFAEIKDKENVFETENDTYSNMLSRVSSEKLNKNINNVINSTIITLQNNSSVLNEVLDNAEDMPEWILSNATYFFGGTVVRILIVAILFMVVNWAKNNIQSNREKYLNEMQNIIKEIDDEIKENEILDPFEDKIIEKENKENDDTKDVFDI